MDAITSAIVAKYGSILLHVVGGSAASGRKQETGVDPMLESPPQPQHQTDDLNSSANASMISSGAPSPSVEGVRSASSLSAPSPGGTIPVSLFQQQQQQQQQAAMAAAAFRAASLANYPQLPPHHLPSLMASLQAVAGVPFHPHNRAAAGLAGLLPTLPFNFPSMAQHQSALLNWSKLAQSAAAAAALGVDGLGSILQQQHQHQQQQQQTPQQHQQQQLSPDSSSQRKSANNKSVNYTGGLIVSGVADKVVKSKAKAAKSAVARRNAKNAMTRQALELLDGEAGLMKPELIIAEPPMVSPVGTTTSSSPPSVTGSSGGSSGGKRSTTGPGEGSRDKVFSCSICQRTFGYKHVLQNHERTHTGEKPFECKQCGKRFTRDHHLKTHMRLHTGEKPYNCTHCDRQFVQVANLRRHLRVHTGERPYACELCTSRFSDSNQLKAHMLIHKGEKPFQCQLCAGRFRRRHHLMHHKCPKDPGALSAPKITKIVVAKEHHDDDHLTESEPPPTPSSYASPPEDDEDEELSLIKRQQQQIMLANKAQRGRKARETRRVVRPVHLGAATDLSLSMSAALASQPEQTEPEDLSTSSRVRHPSAFSVGSTGGWSAPGSVSIDMNSDRDEDEVEDELMLADEELDEDDEDADLSDTADMIRKKRSEHALDLVSARKAKV